MSALAKKFEEKAFDTRRAAVYIGMSTWFLRAARTRGGDAPAHINIGRSVRYLKDDLDRWLSLKRSKSQTSAPAKPDQVTAGAPR